jgi:3-hydroxyisobutyrate dehydrogenase
MASVCGFIGLGNMGLPMAANIAKAGHELLVYDKAGVDLAELPGARLVESARDIWQSCDSVFLSLPNGAICQTVLEDLMASNNAVTSTVIDLSTIGIRYARELDSAVESTEITYVDCPVSGGVMGARAGTITLIWAGSGDLLNQHRPVLESFSGNIFHINEQPGYGQAMKLINNFLSACNMAATSEAMAYGVEEGLDLATMLDVVNVSTGYNSASRDKFPQRIVTQTLDAGFTSAHMNKDVQLYLEGTQAADINVRIGARVGELWKAMSSEMEGSDLTEIYNFVQAHQREKGDV